MVYFRKRWQGLWRHPGKMLLVLALLPLIGLGAYIAGRHVWAEYHFRTAQRALERRDFTEARAHLALCLEVWPSSAETCLLAAQSARRAGSYDEAERHLNAYQRLPGIPEALELERAMLRAQRDDPAPVEGYLQTCVAHDHPDTVLILEALTWGYMKTYRLSHALHCLKLLLERQPDNVQALVWRGEVKDRMRNPGEALADYRRVVELDPKRDDARLRLAELLVHTHRAGEAVEHFEHLRRQQPEKAAILLGLSRCRRELGQTHEARQLLEDLLAAGHPRDHQMLAEWGKLALAEGRAAEAEGWLRQALAEAPYERETTYDLYRCLQQRGKAEEAKELLARLKGIEADQQRLAEVTRKIMQAPADPALRWEAGVILLRNGQEKEGLRWLESALQQDPRHGPTLQTLAEYHQRAGQRQEAGRLK